MAYAFYTKVQKVRPHSNADRLDVATVFGMDTIVSKGSWQAGDECIYFANGGVIAPEYLSKNNMYRHCDLNTDRSVTGYFEDNGRVKTMKLRGEMSDGVIMPLTSLQGFSKYTLPPFEDGLEIDKIGKDTLAQKYIGKTKGVQGPQRAKKKVKKHIPEHIDTSQLNYNLRRFEGPCEVSLSFKLHGTSARFAHLRKKWWQFWKPKFVSGSRRVEFSSKKDFASKPGFYGDNDMRKYYHDKLSKIIPEGYTVYFEIVGWVNDTTPVMPVYNTNKLDKALIKEFGPQMTFSYGCEQGQHEMYVYRITHDDRELSPEEIFFFCEDRELPVVPFCVIPTRPGWHDWTAIDGVDELEAAIKYQFEDYHDRLDDSHLLEGIVVRRKNELGTWEAYKIKTNEFKIIDDIENSGMKPEEISQDVLEEMS